MTTVRLGQPPRGDIAALAKGAANAKEHDIAWNWVGIPALDRLEVAPIARSRRGREPGGPVGSSVVEPERYVSNVPGDDPHAVAVLAEKRTFQE